MVQKVGSGADSGTWRYPGILLNRKISKERISDLTVSDPLPPTENSEAPYATWLHHYIQRGPWATKRY